jgi:uncharacterized phiE125 gp8 family phage protein
MSTRLIVRPEEPAVSMVAARRSARANGTALDDEITGKVQGFTEDAEHETGRALIEQTWEVTLDAFPVAQRGGPGAIQLSKSPVVSVLHVKFYDVDGTQQTLDPADYLVDDKSEPGYVVPAPGKTWPATAARINAVEVQYVCGYGPTADDVPAAIKQYILGKVEDSYYPSSGAQYLCRLLDRYRVYL